jgi:hypothetical protein
VTEWFGFLYPLPSQLRQSSRSSWVYSTLAPLAGERPIDVMTLAAFLRSLIAEMEPLAIAAEVMVEGAETEVVVAVAVATERIASSGFAANLFPCRKLS